MNEAFSYSVKKSITGVHITLSGTFTRQSASALSSCLLSEHKTEERLFLDVRKLTVVNDADCLHFKGCLNHVPAKQVFFKGEQGVRLGHQGSRVLHMKDSPCKCAGACTSCACDKRVKSRNEKFSFALRTQ